jgi:hypothetical protein
VKPKYKALFRTLLAFIVPPIGAFLLNPSVIFFGDQTPRHREIDIEIIVIFAEVSYFSLLPFCGSRENLFSAKARKRKNSE